ncbi:MAG TPA: NAD(P)-dependent oxidoreductase [Stellaceae bacterium]|nr:NAD(P)-dependent oxidoreductase [Stellaceae bacterium]
MAVNSIRIFYVRRIFHPIFAEIIAKRPQITLDMIENDASDEAAAPILAGAHIYSVSSARDELNPKFYVTSELLTKTPALLLVSTTGAGFDTVKLKDCTAAGIAVVNQSGGNREAVAEHVLALMISLSKRIGETDRVMRRDRRMDRNLYMGHDILGKSIGVIGLGNVGGRIAELARGLFAMRVLAYDPYLDAAAIAAKGAEKVGLDELLSSVDFVSVNCPLTDETRGMIGAPQYALMQKHAFFITTARGSIHDETALAAALKEKRIAGAGLDVWAKEPPDTDHPLLAFDNVIASPHSAGVTAEARETMGRIAAEQILATLDGKRPPRLLNPEVWPHFCARFAETFGFRPES